MVGIKFGEPATGQIREGLKGLDKKFGFFPELDERTPRNLGRGVRKDLIHCF